MGPFGRRLRRVGAGRHDGRESGAYDDALVHRTPDGAAALAVCRGEPNYQEVRRSALDALSGRPPSTPRMSVLSEP